MPDNPKIFHILPVDRIESVIRDGKLFSDAIMTRRTDDTGTKIGMSHLKERRLATSIIAPGKGVVGDYVPFYFCPRSVMLFIIHSGRSPYITYKGGQKPIVHLVSNVDTAIKWAKIHSKRWVFTDRNAVSMYVKFMFDRVKISDLRWDLIGRKDFTPWDVKDAKQSEFLVQDSFDWELITEIAVYDETIKRQVEDAIKNAKHKPVVEVRKEWYY